MAVNWKYVLGTTTVVLIVGGTVYAIVKSKKMEKQEDEAISLEEAREIVAREKDRTPLAIKREQDFDNNYEEFAEMMDEVKDQAGWNRSFMPNDDVVEEAGTRTIHAVKSGLVVPDDEEEEEEIDEDDPLNTIPNSRFDVHSVEPLTEFHYYEEGINPKEDKTLRYDPNSVEAKHQFIRMELADWRPDNDVYRIMIQLFEFPFNPMNEGDEILRTQIIDYKMQFFGRVSRWNKEVSFADVIFHYARAAEFNCGETVAYWVEHFLDHNDFFWDMESDHVEMLMLRLNSHTYFNDERQTFGLFGLTRAHMDQAIIIANGNIDRSVTYEIEFNEFLKSCL